MSYLCDKEWWQGKHLNTYLLNSLNLNIADEVFAWNSRCLSPLVYLPLFPSQAVCFYFLFFVP